MHKKTRCHPIPSTETTPYLYPDPAAAKSTLECVTHPGGRNHAKERRSRQKMLAGVADLVTPEPSETPANEDQEGPKPPRLPKRMTALLLGFCGTGCSGMQMCVYSLHVKPIPETSRTSQPNVRTIEGILFDALVRAGAVSRTMPMILLKCFTPTPAGW
ncbi:hypothetical protein JVU11DRAFT_6446 [Chiua virens]|nr:hypothetical protein JVU11DRAFT_6446 [Chiua virens]